jgi:hypothetical protein
MTTMADEDREQRDKRKGRWIMAAIGAAIVLAIVWQIHTNQGPSHDASYKAGRTWAQGQLAAGYADSHADDPDPCDQSQVIYFASRSYTFDSWLRGCESIVEN